MLNSVPESAARYAATHLISFLCVLASWRDRSRRPSFDTARLHQASRVAKIARPSSSRISCRFMMNHKLSIRSFLLFVVAVMANPLASAEDWPRWGGPRGDGTWKGPKLPAIWPRGGLPVVWKKPIGGGYGGVSVAGG